MQKKLLDMQIIIILDKEQETKQGNEDRALHAKHRKSLLSIHECNLHPWVQFACGELNPYIQTVSI